MNNVPSRSGVACASRKLFCLVALIVLSAPFAVPGELQKGAADGSVEALDSRLIDLRTLVEMPENVRMILQGDMLDHLAVMNEINRHLSENDLRSAADVAAAGMGPNLLSKYQNADMRPGKYMPLEMREIGWELHKAATRFAIVARQGNWQKTLLAYQHITSACVACHYSFRTH